MLPHDNPLAKIDDVYNGILVHGNALDDVMFYGKGAGKLPTASAVVSDVIDAVKNAGRHVPIIWEDEELEMGTFADSESRFLSEQMRRMRLPSRRYLVMLSMSILISMKRHLLQQ